MSQNVPNFQKRTILYYPTIDVPDSKWLKQALLYWDNVASIVPKMYDNQFPQDERYTPTIRDLYDQGIFKPYNPEWLVREPLAYDHFESEFKAKIQSENFQKLKNWNGTNALETKIYADKVNRTLAGYLIEERLARKKTGDNRYYYLQKQVALLYMAILAKHLTAVSRDYAVTSTDRDDYLTMNFKASEAVLGQTSYELHLLNLLPCPAPRVTIPAILKFRENYRDELLRFRISLDGMRSDLAKSADESEARNVLASCAAELGSGVSDICKAMEGAKIPHFLGAVKAFLTPTAVVTGVGAAGNMLMSQPAFALAAIPLSIATLAYGSVSVSVFMADQNLAKNKMIDDSAFAYLYLGKREGLLSS